MNGRKQTHYTEPSLNSNKGGSECRYMECFIFASEDCKSLTPMRKLIILFVILSMFCWSCNLRQQKLGVTGDLIKIDISKNYPQKKIRLVDVADVEYVPLETTKNVLIDRYASLHYVSEKYIIVTERGGGDIFVFNRKGKIVTHISHKGRGPEEYNVMSSVVFDEINEEIFVFDLPSTGRILVYSITGEYRRTLKHSTDLDPMAYNFDEETMLVYDINGLNNNNYNKKPYLFLSKKNGDSISSLNINLPIRHPIKVIDRFTDSSGKDWYTSNNFAIPHRRHDGQDFVIADVSSDTIYRLNKNKDLIPFIVCTPSVHSTDPHLICIPFLITEKFVFLYITTLDYVSLQKGRVPPVKTLMYEFESGEISRVDYMTAALYVNTLQKNIEVRMIDAVLLTDLYKAKKLSGELEQLATTLDEEDNPVVMIAKFK